VKIIFEKKVAKDKKEMKAKMDKDKQELLYAIAQLKKD
jgi:hypothetical protein